MVEQERKAEEKRLAKIAAARAEEALKLKREKELLEAAFDGELSLVKKLLGFGIDVNCHDKNNETPLLEAAGGGDVETIKHLISCSADVNARGKFNRTPLFRAAFAGQRGAVEVLLNEGGDPRMYDSEGVTPASIAAGHGLSQLIEAFDLSVTDQKAAVIDRRRAELLVVEQAARNKVTESLLGRLAEAEKADSARQKELKKAREEYEKRIYECTLFLIFPACFFFSKPRTCLRVSNLLSLFLPRLQMTW